MWLTDAAAVTLGCGLVGESCTGAIVKVWAMQPVLAETAESDASQPRLLASLSNHQGGVRTVRWSPSGR